NRQKFILYRKLVGGFLFFTFFAAFLHLLMIGYLPGDKILETFEISAEERFGGGFLGGSIAVFLGNAFGNVGAYIIVIALLILSAIIMTQKPLLRNLAKNSSRVYETAREESKKRKTLRQIQKEEKKTDIVSEKGGDSFFEDIDLSSAVKKKEEVKEVKSTEIKKERDSFISKEFPIFGFDEEESAGENSLNESAFEEKKPEFLVLANKFRKAQKAESKVELQKEEQEVTSKEIKEERNFQKNPKSSPKEMEEGIANIENEIKNSDHKEKKQHKFPPLSLLQKGSSKQGDSKQHLQETARKLQETLHSFGVDVTVLNASCGPTVTRYELQPEQGVKVSRITNLADDIKLNLAASDIRIEAPIPGKAAVGIEVPNANNTAVHLRDLLSSPEFGEAKSSLSFAAGKDIGGKAVITDIAKMPHLLIAGATGSGKSVCINTLIVSILYKANPEDVKLIMIDPKVVELSVYNGIPHLLIPVVTDPKKAAGALNWAVVEMNERYNKFAQYGVRDLASYNTKVETIEDIEEEGKPEKMPQIVIIVDELADLMMVAPGEVEDAICRLAQLARAAGIHLIIATQRPSVNVITGLIKANMPSRIAFSVTSGVDSRTILDMNGAEKLLGKGDMLFYPQGYPKPVRVQGAFVSDTEVNSIVDFLKKNVEEGGYSQEIQDKINTQVQSGGSSLGGFDSDLDVHFVDAGKFIIEKDKASIGMLQRVFKIGFNRAARIMEQLADAGVVGPEEGTKPRKVLMSMEEFENYVENSL
ncbi:MAG TPA: DNA translocase FtsK, partial [Lachnospiraceae bacterium]